MKKNTQWSRKFYVFYDKNDFVKCCGTADELVKGGFLTIGYLLCRQQVKLRQVN